MKKIGLLIVTLLMCGMFNGFAQDFLTGTVTNSKKKPVSNALIYLDSINSGVTTDKKGFYKVEMPEAIETVNVYSYKYGLLSSEVNNDLVINFIYLNDKKNKKDNIRKGKNVAIAYSEDEKKFVARSVPELESDSEKEFATYRTIYDLLRGRVAGVRVSQTNQIQIRGVNSVVGSGDPLFVVDGNPVFSIDNIQPVDVADIKILKGPDAAIYGSRGSNGVIVITTKN